MIRAVTSSGRGGSAGCSPGIPVELQDAIEAGQELFGVLAAAAREHRSRRRPAGRRRPSSGRRGPAPRGSPSWCVPRPGIEHWRRGLVHEELAGALQMLGEPIHNRAEVEGGFPDPAGQRRAMRGRMPERARICALSDRAGSDRRTLRPVTWAMASPRSASAPSIRCARPRGRLGNAVRAGSAGVSSVGW